MIARTLRTLGGGLVGVMLWLAVSALGLPDAMGDLLLGAAAGLFAYWWFSRESKLRNPKRIFFFSAWAAVVSVLSLLMSIQSHHTSRAVIDGVWVLIYGWVAWKHNKAAVASQR